VTIHCTPAKRSWLRRAYTNVLGPHTHLFLKTCTDEPFFYKGATRTSDTQRSHEYARALLRTFISYVCSTRLRYALYPSCRATRWAAREGTATRQRVKRVADRVSMYHHQNETLNELPQLQFWSANLFLLTWNALRIISNLYSISHASSSKFDVLSTTSCTPSPCSSTRSSGDSSSSGGRRMNSYSKPEHPPLFTFSRSLDP